MSVDAIGQSYPNQTRVPPATVGAEQEQPGSSAEISKLSAEIKQAESVIKETAKEVQKAVSESVGGSSEKVQLLQNKIQMQQQTILMKQMKIKEMELPSKAAAVQPSVNRDTPPRVDRYVGGQDRADEPDNVYRMEEKDGTRTIVFNRPEEKTLTGR